jgi:Rrf2 family protein
MKISKKAEYGLRAMVRLAKNKNKRAISIREISNDEGVPFEFLGKIFAGLEKANLITAKHGANGGYYLAKPAKSITAGSIVEKLEGKVTPANCALCGKSKKCLTKNVWRKIDLAINKTLKNITLADLIK